MPALMEQAGRRVGRLLRPAATAAGNSPYHVKYNLALVLAVLYAAALWAAHVLPLSWLIARVFDLNMWVVAAVYLPLLAFLNRYAQEQDKLPALRRLLGLRLLRKH